MPRLHQEAMRAIIADIVTGARAPGDRLPKEVDLAGEFGVSRGVSRETIRALEERGLVSVTHGKGATVNEDRQWNLFDPDVLAVMIETGRTAEVLSQYLECRRILEVEGAALAAQRARKKDVKEIADALARLEDAAKAPAGAMSEIRFHEADVTFHQAVIAASRNQALGTLAERIHSALVMARFPIAQPQYRQTRAMPEHRRIFAAVEAGDPEGARKAMREHLETIASYLRAYSPAKIKGDGARRN